MQEKRAIKPAGFIVGIVIAAFALVGVISTASFAVSKISAAIGRGEDYSAYEEFLSPFIMNDPDAFDDISVANREQLISIAIWSILGDELAPDKYEYTDDGLLVPQEDVESSFTRLFGSSLTIVHSTVDGGGIEFKYSEKKSCYIIPITGIDPIYTPKVLEKSERADSVTLLVGYLAGEDFVLDEGGGFTEPEPSKIMRITLRESPDSDFGYYIAALQNAA